MSSLLLYRRLKVYSLGSFVWLELCLFQKISMNMMKYIPDSRSVKKSVFPVQLYCAQWKVSAHYREHYTLSTTLNTTALRDILNHPVPLVAAVFLLSPLKVYDHIGLAGILDFSFSNPSSCYIQVVCTFSVTTYTYIYIYIFLLLHWRCWD